jgi:hypothetical protein
MHCPNCGKKSSMEHKYCRNCGLGLEPFARALAEQLPAEACDPAQAELLARLSARQRRVELLLSGATLAFLAAVVGAVFYGIVAKIIIEKGQVLGGIAFLAVILLGLVSVGLVVFNESLKEKLAKRHAPDEALPQSGPTGKLLPESRFEPVPSVTERTTELLAVEELRDAKSGRQ